MNPLRHNLKARLAKAAKWYDIVNEGDTAVIRIYDEIGYWGVTAADFARDLSGVTASEILVQINSPGGEVFDGLTIYNALRTHTARVTTRVDGLAASIASVIAQAGDHRIMTESAQMMIHEAWGYCGGSADDIREYADVVERQTEVIASIYQQRSGSDDVDFRALMAAETWLTDAGTVELGLADEVFVPPRQGESNQAHPTPTGPGAPAPSAGPAAPSEAPPTDIDDPHDGIALLSHRAVREAFGSTALAD